MSIERTKHSKISLFTFCLHIRCVMCMRHKLEVVSESENTDIGYAPHNACERKTAHTLEHSLCLQSAMIVQISLMPNTNKRNRMIKES